MTDLDIALAVARAGAAIIRRDFAAPGPATMKGRNNPVTATDEEAEAAMTALIRDLAPGDGILGEEGAAHAAEDGHLDRRWIIDPVDGTVNFVHGYPHVAVSVALYAGSEPLVGVVLDPLRDETFTAAAGQATELNGHPVSVSSAPRLGDALLATGFPYDRHERAGDYARSVERALEVAVGLRRGGSAALDLAWVAAGRLDGYWEYSLAPWDLAAGILLVRQAGGRVTDPSGIDSTPWRPPCVASNGVIHAEFLEVFADVAAPFTSSS